MTALTCQRGATQEALKCAHAAITKAITEMMESVYWNIGVIAQGCRPNVLLTIWYRKRTR